MARRAIMLLTLLMTLAYAYADDAVFEGNGYTVFPVQNTDIRMVSEKIWLRFPQGLGFGMEVEEVFENLGSAANVTIGFPFSTDDLDLALENSPDPEWVPESFDPRRDPHFQTFVDGRPIPAAL